MKNYEKEKIAEYTAINCTPHPVMVCNGSVFSAPDRKYYGGSVDLMIEPSGVVLNGHEAPNRAEKQCKVNGIVVTCAGRRQWESVDPLPEAPKGTYFIVSGAYIDACEKLGIDTSYLIGVEGVVLNNAVEKVRLGAAKLTFDRI